MLFSNVSQDCAQTLQQIIDNATPGATVVVPTGIFREAVVIGKPLTLTGMPGAEIRGSDVWTEWLPEGEFWISANSVPSDIAFGYADPSGLSAERAFWREQVFLDGTPLFQVRANPTFRQFAIEPTSRRVILKDDPAGRFVEVTTREFWVSGEANGVTIQGFRMRHSASQAQTGAIRFGGELGGYSDWIVRDNVLSDAHGAVVNLSNGDRNQITRNDIFRGGQQGIHSWNGRDMLVANNRIHHNNTEGFYPFWEAGAMKATVARNLRLENNEVFDNEAWGLWLDIDCVNATLRNNRCYYNALAGLFFEISDGSQIVGNRCWENGWGVSAWGVGGGITIASSRNAEVRGNLTAWNGGSIFVISQNRGEERWNNSTGIVVRDNFMIHAGLDASDPNFWKVTGLAWVQDWNGVLFDAASNNRGLYNRYWYPTTEGPVRFTWNNEGFSRLADFNATPGEEDGQYITAPDKDARLANGNIPLAPSHGGYGLMGEYFDNADLTNPLLARLDANINFDWGTRSPVAFLESDTFSARWTGWIAPQYSEAYTFFLTSDDGRRLWIDDQLLIDRWEDNWNGTDTGTITLTGGQRYAIRVEYYENQGGAGAVLEWASNSQTKQVVPQNRLYPDVGDGLNAEYFDDRDLSDLKQFRTDSTLDFAWADELPSALVGGECFSIRWTGQIRALYSEPYTIYAASGREDGVRLWVQGQMLIDDWSSGSSSESSGSIGLVAGQRYDVQLEYVGSSDGASVKLSWSSSSQMKEVIPRIHLYSRSSNRLLAPWSSLDVGAAGQAGSVNYDNTEGRYTVRGAGNDIWGSADSFRFVARPMANDGVISARITSEESVAGFAKMGIMIRESWAANSRHIFLGLTPANNYQMVWRERNGGNSKAKSVGSGNADPDNWVRLVRSGNTIRAYVSLDGLNWALVGVRNVRMDSEVYAGLAVTSNNPNQPMTATFDYVSVDP